MHTQCARLNKKFCPKDFSISVFVELDVFFFVTSCSCSLFEKLCALKEACRFPLSKQWNIVNLNQKQQCFEISRSLAPQSSLDPDSSSPFNTHGCSHVGVKNLLLRWEQLMAFSTSHRSLLIHKASASPSS
jgi:hypothetical protein